MKVSIQAFFPPSPFLKFSPYVPNLFFLKKRKKHTAPQNSLWMGFFSIVSLASHPIPMAEALNALAEGTAALRRLSGFLALEEAASPRPPMSEDKDLPLLLAPGVMGGMSWEDGLIHKFHDQNKGLEDVIILLVIVFVKEKVLRVTFFIFVKWMLGQLIRFHGIIMMAVSLLQYDELISKSVL